MRQVLHAIGINNPSEKAAYKEIRSAAGRLTVSSEEESKTNSLAPEDLSLYIHFPYCERKCPYCDFNSHALRTKIPEQEYLAAILWRLQRQAERVENRVLRSVFFGGGTPSLLSPRAVGIIIDGIGKYFSLAEDCEITLEANPSSAERRGFRDLKTSGVNRLSIGVQSFDDANLRFLGRVHNATQARVALEQAMRIFARISFDLIVALPGQKNDELCEEITRALEYESEHLCVYQLTIEKATEFYRQATRGLLQIPTPRRAAEIYLLVEQQLRAKGFANYEISSYARSQEAQARHNLVYWRYGDFIGVGPGAHGRITLAGKTFTTLETRKPERWLAQAQSEDEQIQKQKELSAQEKFEESVMMGLRLAEGLPIQIFNRHARELIDDMRAIGYCEKKSSRVCLTIEGRLRLDTIAAELLVACEKTREKIPIKGESMQSMQGAKTNKV